MNHQTKLGMFVILSYDLSSPNFVSDQALFSVCNTECRMGLDAIQNTFYSELVVFI